MLKAFEGYRSAYLTGFAYLGVGGGGRISCRFFSGCKGLGLLGGGHAMDWSGLLSVCVCACVCRSMSKHGAASE